ncbi:MAG: aminoacyl-tRNA hydrolase, partial [Bacteroidetes bacterium]|nr:aminoacyl-tRNA hydrolase [Bacteroidota bacterium]
VIADDIALPLGSLRLKKKGGAGGHNGLTDIIEHLGTTEFSRLRVGVGNDFPIGYQIKYVLGELSKEEKATLFSKIETAVEIINGFGTIGVERTMNMFNKK